MSRWLVAGLAIFLFAAAGCDVVATTIISRTVDAADDIDRNVSTLHNQGPLTRGDMEDGYSPGLSKLFDPILTPAVITVSETKIEPGGDSPSVLRSASDNNGPEVVRYDTKPDLPSPDVPIAQPLEIAPTSTPSQSSILALVPTSDVEQSIAPDAHPVEPTATVGEEVATPEPGEDCIRPGDMTLWLEPSGGEWAVPLGQSIEGNLCLSNLSTDLAGFDLVMKLGSSDVAEFTQINIVRFGLERQSGVPTDSLRVIAVDLKHRLSSGADGILLATFTIASTGAGESPLTIEINRIDDKDGFPVAAPVVGASLRVSEG